MANSTTQRHSLTAIISTAPFDERGSTTIRGETAPDFIGSDSADLPAAGGRSA